MKVSIRTAYRIVKKTENLDSDPIFVPQYLEEGSEDWHTFDNRVGSGGYNPVYCFSLQIAQAFLDLQKRLQDVVVHYEDDETEWTKNLP